MTKTAAPKKNRSVRLTPDTWQQIEELAQKLGRSQSQVIDRAIDRMYREEFPKKEEK